MGVAALTFGVYFWFFFLVFCAAMYFLPTIIAVMQHRSNAGVVALVNALFGWSFVGWIVAFVLALTREAPVQVVHVHHEYFPQSPAQPGSPMRTVAPKPQPGANIINRGG